MNAKVRIWVWFLSVLVLAVPAVGQTVRGYVWDGGRLKEVGEPIQYTEPYEGEEDSLVANEYNVWTNGASTGHYGTAGNWSLGHVPLITENVIFNRTATGDVVDGFAQGAVNLNSFTVHPQYTGSIGMSGSPLVISTVDDDTGVTGNVIKQGPGAFYLDAGANGIEFLYIDTDEQAIEIEIDGVINNVSILKGRVVALSGFDGGSVWVSYRNNPTSDAHLTIESTAGLGALAVNGGIVLHTGTTDVLATIVSGGRIVQGLNAGNLGVTQFIMTGGYVEYNSTDTLFLAKVLGGTLDLSRDGRPKTITQLVVFPGGKFLPNANTAITKNSQGSILPIIDVLP